jgi:hypothetical protein
MINMNELYTRSEAGIKFFKARKSQDSGACVEVGFHTDGAVSVRDSKRPEQASVRYTPEEWAAFLDGAKNGEFDL